MLSYTGVLRKRKNFTKWKQSDLSLNKHAMKLGTITAISKRPQAEGITQK